AGVVETKGDRFQAVRHRGNGGGRHPVLGQDRDLDQEPAHARRSNSVFGQERAGLHLCPPLGFENRGSPSYRHRGKSVVVSKGAPQVIVDLAKPPADVAQRVKTTVDELAAKGSRALGVARSEDAGQSWSLLGILPMFDPPRDDSKATIEMANE